MDAMTDVLILGGTGWLSRRIAQRWVDAGARVTCLARGERSAPDGAALVIGDRDDPQTHRLLDREWDEVVDIASRADHVRGAVAALGPRAAHWTYISSISVYADVHADHPDESARLEKAAQNGDEYDYSAQKVAAEQAVRTLGDRAHIIRPGLVVGAGDPSDRFGYWAAAFARAGAEPVIVPDVEGRFAQVIDVDDLADFATTTALTGIRNAIGASRPLGEVLGVFRAAAGHTGELLTASDEWLASHGVAEWMGERSLPLWLPKDWIGFTTHSRERYVAAGGAETPLGTVVARVLDDERARGIDRPRKAGLSVAEEHELRAELLR